MRQQLFNVLKVGEEDPTYYNGKSLEIHGIPESAFSSTEEVVLKLAEALEVGALSQDIEISYKLPGKGTKPIIVKFVSHKVKTSLYKARESLKM